jgi:protein-disulfide isomerase
MIERLSRNPVAIAGLVIATALAGAGAALLLEGRTPALGEQARVQRIVHDYLLDNPEILPEVMRRLDDKRTGSVIEANRDAIFTPMGGAWAGNPKGDLTIVEYFDYNCGFCRASLPTIAELLKTDNKLRIVFRELPILSDASKVAARYSVVAARQGKFAQFHQAMYDGGPISEQSIAAALTKAGIDPAKAKTQSDDPSIDVEIENNYAIARQLSLNGTPSWVIGDHVVSSALPLEEMQREIAKARTRS